MKLQSVFIHGRPGPHPFHALLAEIIGAEFVPVDFLVRWHDLPSTRLRRYLSWLLCAMFFPRIRDYHIFLAEGLHFLPIIMRRLGRLRRQQKTVALLDNETLFFLKSGFYSPLTSRALLWTLRRYDTLLCVGRMQTRLAASLLGGTGKPLVLTVRSGIPRQRQSSLMKLQPDLEARSVIFIGNGPAGWRGWYKGLDLLLHTCGLVSQSSRLRLSVLGEWSPEYIADIMSRVPYRPREVEFRGRVQDLAPYLANTSLYVHLSRGDAFGISVLEAMCAGVPALVSEWTGAAEVVERVDPRLVVPLDPERAAERVLWYFELPVKEKETLSAKSREVAAGYTEDRALVEFVRCFRRLLTEFGLPDLPPLPLAQHVR